MQLVGPKSSAFGSCPQAIEPERALASGLGEQTHDALMRYDSDRLTIIVQSLASDLRCNCAFPVSSKALQILRLTADARELKLPTGTPARRDLSLLVSTLLEVAEPPEGSLVAHGTGLELVLQLLVSKQRIQTCFGRIRQRRQDNNSLSTAPWASGHHAPHSGQQR